MLASLTTGRRDLDPEAQVIWPAWCYSGEGGGGGGGARRCVRDAGASPSHTPTPHHAPAAHHALNAAHHALNAAQHAPTTQALASSLPPSFHTQVKTERLSPHDNRSSTSRSRSVTPSTSSYPGTPPERGSPHASAQQPPPPALSAPKTYSEMMRALADRYNTPQINNDYFQRFNGFGAVDARIISQSSPNHADATETPLGGLFTGITRQEGGPSRIPAFPAVLDMSATKTLLAISRVRSGGRSRRKRSGNNVSGGAEHSPLDLSAASESAAKRARLSISPSTSHSGDDRSDCLCAEARARLSAWTVDDVCDFVNSIDICAEYSSNFREQRIDGAGMPLLTEDHLTGMLQMKLGPALKLRAVLTRRLEPCASCQANTSQTNNVALKVNGTVLKSEPRSNTTSPS